MNNDDSRTRDNLHKIQLDFGVSLNEAERILDGICQYISAGFDAMEIYQGLRSVYYRDQGERAMEILGMDVRSATEDDWRNHV